MSLPPIFDTCRPRKDVEAGTVRGDEFTADLSRGVKEPLEAVCPRLSGRGGEVSSRSLRHLSQDCMLDTPHWAAKPSLSEAANDFQARERLRELAFAETVPAPKIPERMPLQLPAAPDDNGEM